MSLYGQNMTFQKELHVEYLKRYLKLMSEHCEGFDSSRLVLAFFSVSGLDIMNSLDHISEPQKKEIIDWVYSLQVDPCQNDGDLSRCGFQGATTFNLKSDGTENLGPLLNKYRCSNLAMNYSALSILIILGDDLSRVNKEALLAGVRALQQEDGCFTSTLDKGESDMRFVFCAAAVCYILDDWSVMDVDKVVKFIRDSMSYEYGIAQKPCLEAHGGSTYCGVATLALMGKLHDCFSSKEINLLSRWCIFRQENGFHGRPNKPDDTCYSFWIGAPLKILGAFDVIDEEENRKFILSNQYEQFGGFSKWTDTLPDPQHTCLALSALSLMKEESLLEVHPALNITLRAFKHLQNLHAQGVQMDSHGLVRLHVTPPYEHSNGGLTLLPSCMSRHCQ